MRGLLIALALLATASALATSSKHIAQPSLTNKLHRKLQRAHAAMVEDADDDDGAAIFRPYTPGEESTIDVPDASKRLFTIILAVPTLALLLGILTYNPTNDELAQEQERKAEQLRRLRGGSTTPANFGRWLLDAALASPVYKLLLVPQAKATMVKTAEDNGVPWRKALAWVREQGPWDLSPDEEAQRLSVPEYYKQPFHAYEEGNLCWDAALEGEIASRAVGARNFPAYGADGELAFRGAFEEALQDIGAKVPDGGLVVDLGCGTGISTRRIAARFPKASSILGIDASPHFLQVGRRLNQLGTKDRNAWEWINAIDEGGYTDTRVELRHGLAEDTKLADASVDVVNLGLVIHELPPSATMDIAKEIYRILKPDGQLWITEMDFQAPAFSKLRSNPMLFSLIRSTEPYLDVYADYQPNLANDLAKLGYGPITLAAATGRHFALVATKSAAGGGPVDDRRAETAKADTHLKTWESKNKE